MRVKIYDNYILYSDGRVWSLRRNWFLQLQDNGHGYKMVPITINGKTKFKYIHRLVGIFFIPNPKNKPWINHKDGIKSNNDYSNLEWSTIKENCQHAFRVLGHTNPGRLHTEEAKLKCSLNKRGKKHPRWLGYYVTPTGTYDSLMEAAKENHLSKQTIYRYCREKKKVEGYSFIDSSF
jgi:hypothetical protein